MKEVMIDFYTVYYRKLGSWQWKKLEKIQEDGFVPGTEVRYFINKYKERIELSMSQIELKFSEERAEIIEAKVKKEEQLSATTPFKL